MTFASGSFEIKKGGGSLVPVHMPQGSFEIKKGGGSLVAESMHQGV